MTSNESGKLVSIIIPAYNVENYIAECLDSLIAQTYVNWEALIIDDGSIDGTWDCIEKYMSMDSRIKGFNRTNAGVSASRNFGLAQVKGYYIQFVDSDDYLPAEAIEQLVKAIEESDADWVNCQYYRVDYQKNPLENYDFIKGQFATNSEEDKFELVCNSLIEYQIGYEVWNKLYKTSIIGENNISFIQDCHIGEDLAFNICYGFHADKINCISDRLYFYRVRTDSAMGTAEDFSKNFREHLALVKGIKPYFEKAFSGYISQKFYQLFFKIMAHASCGHTAVETLVVAEEVGEDYYFKNLSEALKYKTEFKDFIYPEKVKLYYSYGLYIKSYWQGDIKGKIYLKLYDFYRKLRRRPVIGEWRMN